MTTQRRSAVRTLLGELRQRFSRGWRELPAGAGSRWLRTIAVSFVALFAVMFVLMRVAQSLEQSGGLRWERSFLEGVEANPPFSFSSAVWFQTFGTDITVWILVFLTAGIAVWSYRPLRALSIVLAYVALDLVVRFSWALWDRPRPDIVAQGLARPGFASFPSGHTGKTLALYGILCYFWFRASNSWIERAIAAVIPFALCGLVGFSRMRMGVHWPSDVLGGATMGIVWLAVLIYALRFEKPLR